MSNYKKFWKFRDACLEGDTDEMKAICSADSSFIKRENPESLSFLFLAKLYQMQVYSRQGELEKIEALLEENPELVNHPWSFEKWTPLHQATTKKALPVFRYLLKNKANPTLCSNAEEVGGYTVLHAAAWEGNVEAARILVGLGVSVDEQQSDGTTPLQIAKQRRNNEFIEFLTSKGAIA